MDTKPIKDYVALTNRKRELDAELKETNQRLGDLEQVIIGELVAAGFRSVSVDGRTLYLQERVSVSPLNDREEVIGALRASELGQYVAENYNTQSLTAFVSEIKRDVESQFEGTGRIYTEEDVRAALPKPLQGALRISFFHKLGNTKSGS